MSARLRAIYEVVAPIEPGAQYWLNSDCGQSYCVTCINIARGAEFDLGCPVHDPPPYSQDGWEKAFSDGIDGGYDLESDTASACEICGRTLSYILTDEGAQNEIEYYREATLITLRDEDVYALDRMVLNIWAGSPRHMILGASIGVNKAWRLLTASKSTASSEVTL
jgi:hypothetical protein